MTKKEKLKTIKSFKETKFKEKGSVFIGQAFPISSENDFNEILSAVKKKYYDASHHCYAFKLHDDSYKYSDAGEPNGTAGIRILNAIDHFELTGILIIVIRYFGGTKLGVGPLGKAYYNSAYQTLEAAEKIEKKIYKKITIEVDFSNESNVHRILSNYDSRLNDSDYSEKVKLEFFVKEKNIHSIKHKLTELTKGSVIISVDELEYLI